MERSSRSCARSATGWPGHPRPRRGGADGDGGLAARTGRAAVAVGREAAAAASGARRSRVQRGGGQGGPGPTDEREEVGGIRRSARRGRARSARATRSSSAGGQTGHPARRAPARRRGRAGRRPGSGCRRERPCVPVSISKSSEPGGVDVGARVGDPALDLLGGEVGDGADQHARRGSSTVWLGDGPGQAEVGDLDRAVVGEDDVLGLDVAVDQAGLVRRARAPAAPARARRAPRAGLSGPSSCSTSRSVRPATYSIARKTVAVVLALVVDGDDVRVGQARRGARLAAEAGDELVVVRRGSGRMTLSATVAVEPLVDAEVDRGHAAVGDARSTR